MFIDFNKTFGEIPQSQNKVPQVLIDEMNKSLRDDLRSHFQFIALDNGTCVLHPLDSSNKEVTIRGLSYDFTEEQKHILGAKPSSNDIAFYLYNSQDKIKLLPIEEDIIILNNTRLPLSHFCQIPLQGINCNVSEISMSFPKTKNVELPITIGTSTLERDLKIKRIPNKSLSELKFESDPEDSLYIFITYNTKTQKSNFTLKNKLNKAKSVKELCDNFTIYDAYLNGDGYFMGQPIEGHLELDKDSQWANEAAIFWNKVLKIEEVLDVNFSLPDSIENEDVYLVEELYQSLINKVPIQARYSFTSLTGQWKALNDDLSYEELKGTPLTLNLTTINNIDLFNISKKLPVLTVISNALIINTKTNNNETTIYLDENNPNQFNAIQYFKNNEELEEYRSTHNLDHFLSAPSLVELLTPTSKS